MLLMSYLVLGKWWIMLSLSFYLFYKVVVKINKIIYIKCKVEFLVNIRCIINRSYWDIIVLVIVKYFICKIGIVYFLVIFWRL